MLVLAVTRGRGGVVGDAIALMGEARTGGLTLVLPDAVADVHVREARLPGRPIVLIDPGHGGRDPGAPGVSGTIREKDLTLAMAKELADLLEQRGRVRVALTREDDKYLTLDQRAAFARRLQAGLFLSLHMDSAPNPLAKGATVYSLSDVASSAEAARFAEAENRSEGALSSEPDDRFGRCLPTSRCASRWKFRLALPSGCCAGPQGGSSFVPAAPVRRLPCAAPGRNASGADRSRLHQQCRR